MAYYGQQFGKPHGSLATPQFSKFNMATQSMPSSLPVSGQLLQYNMSAQYPGVSSGLQYHGVQPALGHSLSQQVSSHYIQQAAAASSVVKTDPNNNNNISNASSEHKRKLSAMALMPPPATAPTMQEVKKQQDYKLCTMQEIYMWYMTRQHTQLAQLGNRAIVENLIIYLEGLNVHFKGQDLSLTESISWRGIMESKGGTLPHDSFRDSLCIDTSPVPKKTCSFINDTVINFLHTGTLGSLCMIETISSYFIPVHCGSGLSNSDIYEEASQSLKSGVAFRKLSGGYSPGECGTLNIRSDGTYALKAYGIIVVIGLDFVAATCKQVSVERLTTSSVRLLHPSGAYQLPRHVMRYRNRPVTPQLRLPSTPVPGTTVYLDRVHC